MQFHHLESFMQFYTVQRSDMMRGPFGFLGPFPTEQEAQSACDFFSANSTQHKFTVARGGLADDMTSQEELADEYQKAKAKLGVWQQH